MSGKAGHYGINQFTENSSEAERYAEEIKINGYTIIENVLDQSALSNAHKKLDEIYKKQLDELGDEKIITTIKDVDITRAMLTYDDFFLFDVAANPKVIEVMKSLLGNYFILREQNGITNRPNLPNYQLNWHRDILFQNFTISTPIAISVLFCLDDFTVETGGTYILPGSHKINSFPSPEYIKKNEVCANAKAGSAIAFDSMLFHRAGYNSSPTVRRGINNVYALPFISQPVSFPKMLDGKFNDDAFLKVFLGYETQTDASVYDWRMRRYNRIEKQA